jgi:hypothetical protein
MNVYWASQHYEDLAGIRQRQGLHVPADTPPFLIRAHASAMDERAERGGKVEHKVRQIARRAMRRAEPDPVGAAAQAVGSSPRESSHQDMKPGWNQPELRSGRAARSRVPQQPKETT